MVFNITEDRREVYKKYAHAAGFSICNLTKIKDKQSVRWKYIICLKEYFEVEKKVRGSSRISS
ncbi:hypothetical protein AHAS_Ahas01G0179900 [Arachis hypogaea]